MAYDGIDGADQGGEGPCLAHLFDERSDLFRADFVDPDPPPPARVEDAAIPPEPATGTPRLRDGGEERPDE